MDLLQLRYFCDAAESENFSHTAARYMVPPSGISGTVKRLEGELGAPLFDRRANRITLNAQGRNFYARVRPALSMIDDACREMRDASERTDGEIRILVSSNRRIVAEAVDRFRREHPRVSFTISHTQPEERGDFELIITDDPSLFPEYTATPLIEEKLLLALQEGSKEAETELSREELSRMGFVCMGEGSSLGRAFDSICRTLGISPEIVVRVDDPYYLRRCVSLGLGAAVVPEFSFLGQLDGIVTRELGDFRRTTYVLERSGRYGTVAVRDFVALLTDICRDQLSSSDGPGIGATGRLG